jgi:ABC-2 type transport system permease protein
VNIWISFGITLGFLAICVAVIAFIFRTGWRLRA